MLISAGWFNFVLIISSLSVLPFYFRLDCGKDFLFSRYTSGKNFIIIFRFVSFGLLLFNRIKGSSLISIVFFMYINSRGE